MRSSWIRVAPNPLTKVFIQEEKDLDAEGEAMSGQGQRLDGCGPKPRNAWGSQELEEAGSFLRVSRRSAAL